MGLEDGDVVEHYYVAVRADTDFGWKARLRLVLVAKGSDASPLPYPIELKTENINGENGYYLIPVPSEYEPSSNSSLQCLGSNSDKQWVSYMCDFLLYEVWSHSFSVRSNSLTYLTVAYPQQLNQTLSEVMRAMDWRLPFLYPRDGYICYYYSVMQTCLSPVLKAVAGAEVDLRYWQPTLDQCEKLLYYELSYLNYVSSKTFNTFGIPIDARGQQQLLPLILTAWVQIYGLFKLTNDPILSALIEGINSVKDWDLTSCDNYFFISGWEKYPLPEDMQQRCASGSVECLVLNSWHIECPIAEECSQLFCTQKDACCQQKGCMRLPCCTLD
jgi:hypothetical protein